MTDPPSKQPPTPPPTAKKVVTLSPTRRPTNKPVVEVTTSTPSLRPVFVPDTNTPSPTDKGTQNLFSNAPTDAPSATLTVTPTSAPFTDVTECGNDVCQSSEDSVVCAPDCKGVELVSPDSISSDVATIGQEGVYFTIESDRDIIVTGMLIHSNDGNGTFENGVAVYAQRGEVGYDTLMANEGNVLYSTTNSLSGSDETTGGAKEGDHPITKGEGLKVSKGPSRNKPCPCGSKKAFKACCSLKASSSPQVQGSPGAKQGTSPSELSILLGGVSI